MTLDLDLGRALRTRGEREALVRAVHAAPASEPEPEHLEWKSKGDLRRAKGQHEIMQFVLGAANRDPAKAQRAFEGCAYLLMGVSPGTLDGVVVHDTASLQPAVVKFVGDDEEAPRWDLDYVRVDGVDVLVVSVEAPRDGDPIYTQRRDSDTHEHKGHPDGTIWVRDGSRTRPAKSADVRRLEARARRSRDRVEVAVRPSPAQAVLRAVDLSPEACERWLESERAWYEDPLRPAGGALGEVMRRQERVRALVERQASVAEAFRGGAGRARTVPERRTQEEYLAEVQEYLDWLRPQLPGRAALAALRQRMAVVALELANPGERNFHDVQVVVRVHDAGQGYLDAEDLGRTLPDEPEAPRRWGPWKRGSSVGALAVMGVPRLGRVQALDPNKVSGHDPLEVTFAGVSLRAEKAVPLAGVLLVLDASQAGKSLVVEWSATARDVDGTSRGQFELEVCGSPVSAHELLMREAEVGE